MGSLAAALLVALVVVSYLLFRATIGASETMTGVWNVAVADFTSTGKQPISRDVTEKASNVFYSQLNQELSNLASELGLSIDVWSPKKTGKIEGATQAEKRANAIGANILIYGTVERDDGTLKISPEFFVDITDTYETEELVGEHAFGSSVMLYEDGKNLSSRIEVNQELARRAQALSMVTKGLTYYVQHQYQAALDWFDKANHQNDLWDEDPGDDSNQGREVIYQFAGNSAALMYQYDLAEADYQEALVFNHEYARAYLGLGQLRYFQALEGVTADSYNYDLDLLDEAMDYIDQGLSAEYQPLTADVPAKAAFLKGQVYIARWLVNQSPVEKSQEQFKLVIEAYNNGENERLTEFAAESYARLGLIERQLGNLEAAIEYYDAAQRLTTHPGRKGLFLAKLADLYDDEGQLTKALEYSQLSIQQYNVAIHFNYPDKIIASYYAEKAQRHQYLGELDEAVKAYERAVKLSEEGSSRQEYYQSMLDAIK